MLTRSPLGVERASGYISDAEKYGWSLAEPYTYKVYGGEAPVYLQKTENTFCSDKRTSGRNVMSIEMLVGVNVVDDETYQSYRDEMGPILASYGGAFGYDFRVSEVLRSKTEAQINRVFTISFTDADSMKSFFSDDGYIKAKQGFFDKSVTDTTIIATYEK